MVGFSRYILNNGKNLQEEKFAVPPFIYMIFPGFIDDKYYVQLYGYYLQCLHNSRSHPVSQAQLTSKGQINAVGEGEAAGGGLMSAVATDVGISLQE